MTHEISTRLRTAIYAQESPEILTTILRLSHPAWEAPVCLISNGEPLTHGGETYHPFPFTLTLPESEEGVLPVLKWEAQNVTRELIPQLRSITGEIYARVAWVLTSTPDVVERGPFEVQIYGVDYDALRISGTMTLEPVLEEQFGWLTMAPGNTPALF